MTNDDVDDRDGTQPRDLADVAAHVADERFPPLLVLIAERYPRRR